LAPQAAKTAEFDITRQFFKMLEQSIRRQPAFYLWTHDRWKRSHAEFDRRYEVVNGKIYERK
jgi:KDO2-lipid IV(A) lauroyltransferase